MKIIYVRPGKSAGYLTIGIISGEEKHSLTVSESDYAEAHSPRTGDIIDDDIFAALSNSDESYRAHIFALRILSYADNNEKTLVRKLVQRGISYAVAVGVSHEMVSHGYIDESRQLARLVLTEANSNLSGPGKLRAKLISKGYSASDIDCTVERLIRSGEVDFSRSAELLIAKKLTRDATDEEKKKLLYKNGYNIC